MWVSGGAIEFRSVGTVYDILHFPDDFQIPVARPAEAYKMELKDRFPGHATESDSYFDALLAAEEALRMVAAERSMPEPFRSAHRWWNKKKIQRWCWRIGHRWLNSPRVAPKRVRPSGKRSNRMLRPG